MTGFDDKMTDDLASALRRDAASWEEPDACVLARLDEVIGRVPSHEGRPGHGMQLSEPVRWRPRAMGVAAAAALIFVVGTWCVFGTRSERDQGLPVRENSAMAVGSALVPLERELVALGRDASSIAEVVWHGVPAPLRRLLAE